MQAHAASTLSGTKPRTSILPVTAADMRAERRSWRRVIARSASKQISPGKAGGFKDVSRSKRLGGDADAAPKLEPPEGGFLARGRWRSNLAFDLKALFGESYPSI